MFSRQRASFDVEHLLLRGDSMHLPRLNASTRDAYGGSRRAVPRKLRVCPHCWLSAAAHRARHFREV
jgi:hypothetical protein